MNFVLALSIVTAFSGLSAHAEVPKTCQELSGRLIETVSQAYSQSDKILVSVTVPMLAACETSKIEQYNFSCNGCFIPVQVRYMDGGVCYQYEKIGVQYKDDFSKLQLIDFAMAADKCTN